MQKIGLLRAALLDLYSAELRLAEIAGESGDIGLNSPLGDGLIDIAGTREDLTTYYCRACQGLEEVETED